MTEHKRATVGLVSLGVGLAAAGVGAAIGLAAEHAAFARTRPRPDDEEDLGSLHVPGIEVTADDGTRLHVEIDEPAPEAGREPRSGRVRDRDAQPTLVFSHGYALTMDSWHYQRLALRGRYRMVFWDQRGHGRSGEGPDGSATIAQIGADLEAVLAAAAPDGPLVLIGHSMGGMTVMSLAERDPALIADRVIGAALVSTSAGGMGNLDFGLPRLGRFVHRVAPSAARVLTQTPGLVERGRRIGSDLEAVLVRRYSFASRVSPQLVRFTADMIASTRIEVISDFLPTLAEHDKREALAALDGIEVLVIVGDSDLLTPVDHSEEIVRRLPGAEHIVVREAGHLLMLEYPDVVTSHLLELIERAQRGRESRGPRRGGRIRHTITPLRRRRRHRDGAA